MGLRTGIARLIARWTMGQRRIRREILRLHWSDGSLFFRRFNDHQLVYYPHDVIGEHLSRNGEFSRAPVRKLAEILERHGQTLDDGTIVEVGANIGTHSVYFFRDTLCNHLVAVEPDPENFDLLTLNIHLNDLSDKVNLLNAGASNRPGSLPFHKDPINRGGSRFGAQGDSAIPIEVTTLDRIIEDLPTAQRDVRLIWIDVEGHELQVLEGALRTIEQRKPPIFVEYTPRPDAEDNLKLWHILSDNYPSVYDFANLHDPLTLQDFVRIGAQTDLLACGSSASASCHKPEAPPNL